MCRIIIADIILSMVLHYDAATKPWGDAAGNCSCWNGRLE